MISLRPVDRAQDHDVGFILDLAACVARREANVGYDGIVRIGGIELTQDADGVDVTFASGDRRRFELVIGADGLHSALRTMVFGPPEQFVRHLGLVLAFYSVPNEFGLDRWLIDYQEAGRSVRAPPQRGHKRDRRPR